MHAQDVSRAILEAARDAGLVVGVHGHSRIAGILLGSTTSRAVHNSPVPVLVARGRPELGFPGVMLVGTQGIEDRHHAVVAGDHRRSPRHARRPRPRRAIGFPLRHALAEQAADVLDITGKDPVVVSVDGPPVDRLPAMASSIGAGLVVLTSHGRRGPRALPSVSEGGAPRPPARSSSCGRAWPTNR